MPSKPKPLGKKREPRKDTNPFEARWEKSHQTTLRKRSQSTSKQHSGRNVFADRRIGEDDPSLDEENRYLYRLQRERTQRVRKRARFSLLDEESPDNHGYDDGIPEFSATNIGVDNINISEKEDDEFSDGAEDGDDDELLKLKESTEAADDEERERTKQEIMDEVVQKSKLYKAQRQHEKYIAEEQTAKLDEKLPELMHMLAKSGADYDKQQASKPKLSLKKAQAPTTIFGVDDTENRKRALPATTAGFQYEDVYRQLANERRARPSERLLTEEEKTEHERDRLVELERERKARMESMDASDDENNADRSKKRGTTRKRGRGGDDLDDGFELSELGDGSSESGSDEYGEDLSEDNDEELASHALGGTFREVWTDIDPLKLVASKACLDEDIPYAFKKCPATPLELQVLFDGRTVRQRGIILERLLKCFAISLNPVQNRRRLEALVECLLSRVERLAEVQTAEMEIAIEEIDMLLLHLHNIGQLCEKTICAWCHKKLVDLHTALTSSRQGLSSLWKVCDVVVMRAIGRLYPTSDLRHSVCTPLSLLLSEGLAMRHMQTLADVALGVFVGDVLLELMAEKEGYSSDLGMFLLQSVLALCPVSEGRRETLLLNSNVSEGGGFRKLQRALADVKDFAEANVPVLSLRDCLPNRSGVISEPTRNDRDFAQKVILSIVGLTEALQFSGNQRHLDLVLSRLPVARVPFPDARKRLSSVISQALVGRVPLTLYTASTQKPVARSLNPKFSAESGVFRKRPKTSYHAGAAGDVSASAKRVRRALRKEERGLARDVRREAEVLASRRAEADQVKNEARDRRHKEVMGFLAHQQATWKAAEKRQKQLSGKKW